MIQESPAPSGNSAPKPLPDDFDFELLEPVVDPETGIDVSLIKLNLQMTPWERIVANNDVINFGDGLQTGVKKHTDSSQLAD